LELTSTALSPRFSISPRGSLRLSPGQNVPTLGRQGGAARASEATDPLVIAEAIAVVDQAKVDQPLQKLDRRDQIRARVQAQDRVAPVAPVVDLVQSQALVLVVQVAADPVEVVLVAPVAAAGAPGLALRARSATAIFPTLRALT